VVCKGPEGARLAPLNRGYSRLLHTSIVWSPLGGLTAVVGQVSGSKGPYGARLAP